MKPTPEQRAVIEHPLEPLRVTAGAGTGKTSTMALRLVHLVESHSIEPEEALGITFTNKAAEELAARVRSGLAEQAAAGHEVQVLTYHGFALGLIREFGPFVGISRDVRLIPTGYVRQLLREAAAAEPILHLDLTSPGRRVDELARLWSILGDHLVDPADLAAAGDESDVWQARRELARILEAYRRRKDDLGAVDYADLVTFAHRLVQDPAVAERIRSRYRVVLLDEYQDTNPSQRELLRAVFAEGFPVTAVGDSDQTIYEWRGASTANFSDFVHHFPRAPGEPATSLELSVNWRSARRIIDVANSVRSNITRRSDLERLTARPGADAGTVTTHWLRTALDEADWIAGRLGRMHDEGRTWSDMAVLFRKHRQIALVRDALADHGIPVEVASLGGLLEVPEVADLHAWLRILGRPEDAVALSRLLLGADYRLGLADLAPLAAWARARSRREDDDIAVGWALLEAVDALESVNGLSEEAGRRLRRFRAGYRDLLEAAQGSNLVELCRLVLDRIGAWQEVDALGDAARLSARLNLYRFLDLAETWSPLEGGPSLDAFLDYLDLLSEDAADDALDTANVSGEDAVLLITVHRAKGLEWPVVVLPALCQGTFPSGVHTYDDPDLRPHVLPHHMRLDADDLPVLDGDDESRKAALRERHDDQEWRTAYVAVTRARDELIASGAYWYTPGRAKEPSPLFGVIDAVAEPEAGRCDDAGESPGSLHRERRWDDVPDPLFAGGWQAALSEAVADPDIAVRLADEAGLTDRFEAALEQLRLRLEALPEPRTADEEPEPFRTSVTGVVTFAACPQRFHWGHVDRLPRRPSPASRRGVEVHRMIERRLRGTLTFDDFAPDFDGDTRGTQGPVSTPFERFLGSRFAHADPILVEAPFSLLVDGGRIDGRIDAVYEPEPGLWEVVDFKSGRSGDDPSRRVQLEAYALAVDEAGFLGGRRPDSIRVTFAYLGDDEVVEVSEDVDAAWLDRARKRLAALITSAADGHRKPTPSDACRWCDFARFCAAGTTWLEGNP